MMSEVWVVWQMRRQHPGAAPTACAAGCDANERWACHC